MWPARRADNSVVLVVLNVKVRMEAQLIIPTLNLHNLQGEIQVITYISKGKRLNFRRFMNLFEKCEIIYLIPGSKQMIQ